MADGGNRISAVVLTKNEERNIGRCLASLAWADDVLVLDSGSTDRTLEICRDHPCRVEKTAWLGFGTTWQKAVGLARHDWVLVVAADEEVTPELADSVRRVMPHPVYAGYKVRRTSFYLGRKIRFSGWNRDFPLRLFDRRRGGFNDKIVHESIRVPGPPGRLEGELLHYSYPDLQVHVRKLELYAALGAEQMRARGRRVTRPGAVCRGILKFMKMYLLQRGFLDGRHGLVLARYSAHGVYLKYRKLWDLTR